MMKKKKQELIAQLTEAGNEYRYREQLITKIFIFCLVISGSIATFALAQMCNPQSRLSAIGSLFIGGLVVQIFGWYLFRLNQDRRRAGHIKHKMYNALRWKNPHAGYSGNRVPDEVQPFPQLREGERVAEYMIRIARLFSSALLCFGLISVLIWLVGLFPSSCTS